jgi:hypothetical protein
MTFLAPNQIPQTSGERYKAQTCNSKKYVPAHPVDFGVWGWWPSSCPVVERGQIQKPQERQQKKDGRKPQR